jgi:O-antigen/teichoic acid export membrane protein
LETGFFRFINKKEEQHPLRVYSTVLYSIASTSILFVMGVLLFIDPVSQAFGYTKHPEFIGLMAVTVAIDAFLCMPFAYLRYQGKAFRFAKLKLYNIGLTIFLNIVFLLICPAIYNRHPEWIGWFYKADYGVGYIFVSNLLATFFTFCLLLPDMFPGLRIRPDVRLLRQILAYSYPILLLGIAGIFNQTADKILFRFLFDDKEYAAEQLGIYGACFKIAVVMVMFIQAFRYAYEPFVFAKNKSDDNRQAYVAAMKYFIMFALFIFLGVMFYMDILKYFVGAGYHAGLRVVPIVMLGELFFGIYFNLSIWYKLTDRTIWGALFSTIGCIATVLIIFFFVPRYGFIACAWASFASNLLMMFLSWAVGQKKYPVRYDLRSAFFFGILAAVFYVIGMYLSIDSIVLRLVFRTSLLIFYLGFIVRAVRAKQSVKEFK